MVLATSGAQTPKLDASLSRREMIRAAPMGNLLGKTTATLVLGTNLKFKFCFLGGQFDPRSTSLEGTWTFQSRLGIVFPNLLHKAHFSGISGPGCFSSAKNNFRGTIKETPEGRLRSLPQRRVGHGAVRALGGRQCDGGGPATGLGGGGGGRNWAMGQRWVKEHTYWPTRVRHGSKGWKPKLKFIKIP